MKLKDGSKIMWVLNVPCEWDRIHVLGKPLKSPPKGPHRFLPIFETREQAIAKADTEKNVVPILVRPDNC